MTPAIELAIIGENHTGFWWDMARQQSAHLFSNRTGGRYIQIEEQPAIEIDGWQVSWRCDQMLSVGVGISLEMVVTATKDGQTWSKRLGWGPAGTDTEWSQEETI